MYAPLRWTILVFRSPVSGDGVEKGRHFQNIGLLSVIYLFEFLKNYFIPGSIILKIVPWRVAPLGELMRLSM